MVRNSEPYEHSFAGLGLAEQGEGSLTLTRRGRFLGGGVTARLLA